MIHVENLSKSYAGGTILEQASFKINKGERCGLVGRNGSGKTTLMRLIVGEELSEKGTIFFPKGYSIAYLQQNLIFTKNSLLDEASLALPPEETGLTYKVEKILGGLGFSKKDMLRHPNEFSGGYQLRLHLAKVLIVEPNCLLLDEPTNYLDIVSIRWLTQFLQKWKNELLIISHDRNFMDSITTHTLGIHRKKISKIAGNTEKFYQKIIQEEDVYTRTQLNLEKKRSQVESFIEKFGAKATKASQAQSKRKALEKMPALKKLTQEQQLSFSFNYAPFPGQVMLKAEKLCFSYSPPCDHYCNDFLINELSLSIEKGSCTAVVGKNGKGKTTLLNLLSQELKLSQGLLKPSVNLKIAYFGQTNINRLNPKISVEEEIASASSTLSFSQVRNICSLMMFQGDKAKKTISCLSGGEKSRVLLGKIIATPCNLLLLDEPSNHLDMESIEALIEALTHFPGSIIIVTHNENLLKRLPSQLIICHENRQVLFPGTYDEFIQKDGWGDLPKRHTHTTSPQKELKKKRAELLSARAKALRHIQQRINTLETSITTLEEEINSHNELLIKASKDKKSSRISELSIAIANKQKKVDCFFEELDTLTKEFDSIHQEYEEKLKIL